jgi:hypothetical protein
MIWICSWRCRARELFYYLKGGQVDYGEGHSKVCGHTRFGRMYHTGTDFQQQNTFAFTFQEFLLGAWAHSSEVAALVTSNWAQGTILCGMTRTRCTLLGTRLARRL